ncbi:MAG TPA: hypothetical protein VJ866_10010 [Pyrinomonadaceae bacterium]|nr:hypothetical protein [Pyrinomonadaceae bacterium]
MAQKTLKPTLILALDPFAAAFCAEARWRLERLYGADLGGPNTLIQAAALARRGGSLGFELDLDPYLDPAQGHLDFDLEAARAGAGAAAPGEAEALFETYLVQVEDALAEILLQSRSLDDIEAAKRAGFEVSDARRIYVVLSSSDAFAAGSLLQVTRVIRWLFTRRLADELFSLHALVLLPDLFAGHGSADYAVTYGLFKKLDDAFANGLSVAAHFKPQPFETCWVIDGRNNRGVGTGTLAANLAGYADAFAGLIYSDPEDSMATPGISPGGRPPNYNSFGYGELYLPTAEAVARLSAALAHDVTRAVFLGEAAPDRLDERQRLSDVTRFVQRKDFASRLEQVNRGRQGLTIWQPVKEADKIRPGSLRPEAVGEYVTALRRRHEEFGKSELLEYRDALFDSGERVLAELTEMLDAEIDRRADASPAGLPDAVEYLHVMVEHAVELRQFLGEVPQNLLSALRAAEGSMDGELGVEPSYERSAALLAQIHDLRGSLEELRTDLRLLLPAHEARHDVTAAPAAAGAAAPGATAAAAPEGATAAAPSEPDFFYEPPPAAPEGFDFGAFDPEASPLDLGSEPHDGGPDAGSSGATDGDHGAAPPPPPPPEPPPRGPETQRQRLGREIEEAERHLADLGDEYRDAVEVEDKAAYGRREARLKEVLSDRVRQIAETEESLSKIAEALGKARRDHEYLLEEQRLAMRRQVVVRPTLFALVFFGIPLLAALGGVWPATEIVIFVLDHLSEAALVLLVLALIYSAVVFYNYFTNWRPRVAASEKRVRDLDAELNYTARRLFDSHNALQHFKFKVAAWTRTKEAIARLIGTAQDRIEELNERLEALRESADLFARERDAARPLASPMRRPLLLAEDIDAYYAKRVTSVEAEGEAFMETHKMRRKMVRRVTAEEFRKKLRAFAEAKFEHLRELSVTDAMLYRPDLVPPKTADLRLRELDEAAELLLRLRRSQGPGAGRLAQRDVTLWASPQARERVQEAYERIRPRVNIRASDDEGALRVLTRCLYFPAFHIGPVEFYRERYSRAPQKIAEELPDVLPIDERMRRAYKRFLLALATGVVVRDAGGLYRFADGTHDPFGDDRREIAEKLAGALGAQKLMEELDDRLNAHLETVESVAQRLTEFAASTPDLDAAERRMVDELVSKTF